MAGVYIHVPFCLRKCPYCDFYSGPLDESTKNAYVKSVINQLAGSPGGCADTVYFGGGTPSLLEAGDIAAILEAVKKGFCLEAGAEITLEMNPATCSDQKLLALREAGINRLSVGVQSTDDRLLASLGRLHSGADALAAIESARKTGFCNISADLMLATPGSTPDTLARSINDLVLVGVSHLSAYLLKVMPGTPFAEHLPALPGEDAAAEQYERCCSEMAKAGFLQYEISNFAKPGFESRHNLKYWLLEDYYGFGPAAHSCFGGRRYSTPADTKGFLSTFSAPSEDITKGMLPGEKLDAEDMIVTFLRTAKGLDTRQLRQRFGRDLLAEKGDFIDRCQRAGLMRRRGDVISITRQGFLVSNSILAELI